MTAETVEQFVVRHAEAELRNVRRRLALDARRASNLRPGRKRPLWLPRRPRGRPERWLRDYFTNRAIDRLRAERGLSVREDGGVRRRAGAVSRRSGVRQ